MAKSATHHEEFDDSMLEEIRRSNIAAWTGNFTIYWVAIASVFLAMSHSALALLAIPFMIIIYHGTHEAAHGNIVPEGVFPPWLGQPLALVSGVIGFAVVGHNFLFLRWSHQLHHEGGRLEEKHTLDGPTRKKWSTGWFGYYFGLLGWNCYFHELMGYLMLVIPNRIIIGGRRFDFDENRRSEYAICQLAVFAVTAILLMKGGLYFVACRVIFAIYWGSMQNVSHYGLEHGKQHVARTYRLNSILEYVLFRGGFYHIEHHVFPSLPGYCLSDPRILAAAERRLGVGLRPKHGTLSYYQDFFTQYQDPNGKGVDPREWKESDRPLETNNT